MKIAGNGRSPSAGYRERDLGRIDLASERVAAHRDVDEIERLLRQIGDVARRDDHPHAGAPERHPVAHARADRLDESETLEQANHGRRFTARDDERIDAGQIGRSSTSRVRAPARCSARRCSMTSPCSARTPTMGAGTLSCRG
jgi:hypothetical protein